MKFGFNNIKKHIVTVSLLAAAFVCTAVPAYAAEDMDFALKAQLGPESELNYSFRLWQPEVPEENCYSITLPHEVKSETLRVELNEGTTAVFDGKEVKNGTEITAPSQGVHKLVCNGTEYKITAFYGSDIPSVYITTESGSMQDVYADKSHKEPGIITIMDDETVQYNGELDYIKGRGNHTWTLVKKPFNIKLADKADLFGMGKSKGWSLLANYVDVSHLKNRVIYDFADTVGINFSSKSTHADLYVNGEYLGLYTITEKVEIDDNRVEVANLEKLNEEANPDIDIEECELAGTRGETSALEKGSYKYVKIPNNPEDITGGYLLEFELDERYDAEVSGFVSEYGQPIVVKSPEFASKEQVEYIRGYYQEFEDAVLSDDGYNSLGKHYSEYMDMESMAKMYVYHEYAKNMEVGLSSFYFYKDAGEKLYAGPVWDFDKALGHEYRFGNIELADSQGYIATGSLNDVGGMSLVTLLCRFPEFRQLAAQQWEEYFVPNTDGLISDINTIAAEIRNSALADKNKWTEGFARSTADVAQWHDNKVTDLQNFVTMREHFMSKHFDSDKVYVSYRANNAEGLMFDANAYNTGNTVKVKESDFANGKREFLGWNTEADGSGTAYMPDEEFEITENVTLYAQWEKPSFFEMIAEFFASLFN